MSTHIATSSTAHQSSKVIEPVKWSSQPDLIKFLHTENIASSGNRQMLSIRPFHIKLLEISGAKWFWETGGHFLSPISSRNSLTTAPINDCFFCSDNQFVLVRKIQQNIAIFSAVIFYVDFMSQPSVCFIFRYLADSTVVSFLLHSYFAWRQTEPESVNNVTDSF